MPVNAHVGHVLAPRGSMGVELSERVESKTCSGQAVVLDIVKRPLYGAVQSRPRGRQNVNVEALRAGVHALKVRIELDSPAPT